MYNKRKFSLGICILTWNKPKTLKNTLKSYEKFGLLDIVTEKIILCQENNQDEINIAKSFGFTIYHTEKNIGIGKGIFLLTKKLTSKYMIFLENDWELLNDKFTSEILTPINYISHGIIHAYKLRHRYNYGEPLWSMNWCKNKELTDTRYLLDSVHWIQEPEKRFPKYIKYKNIYIASSKYANYTNNPVLYDREWFLKNITTEIKDSIGRNNEKNIQAWWEHQEYKIGQGEGLFRHTDLHQ